MDKIKIYLLAEDVTKGYTAGEKARKDVLEILQHKDYIEHIKFFDKGNNKIFVLYQIFYSFIKLLCEIKENDYLIIQYPYSPKFMYTIIYKCVDMITKIKKAKKIALIHDINYLRNDKSIKDEFSKYDKKLECSILNKFDKIICHNNIMKETLSNDGVIQGKLISLDIFDYISDNIQKKRVYDPNNIIISLAGKLDKNKSGYIYELKNIVNKNIKFELYGIGYIEDKKDKNVEYKGVAKPEELPNLLKGNFGLVWDGNSLDKCDGLAGEYLKYNNPHKVSSYIACGLPVIVWKKAAIADFIIKNNLGICVDNLNEINSVINELNEEKYNILLENVNKIKKKIIKGEFLIEAINKCI